MSVSVAHTFLQTFLAGYRCNKPYLVIRNSRPALQCLRIFHHYGLVERYGHLANQWERRRFAPTVSPATQQRFLLVWFHRNAPDQTLRNQKRWLVERQAGDAPSAKAPHRLELLRRPSARSQLRFTLRQLKGQVPNLNAVYILETPMGVLTSREARNHNVGGNTIAIL